MPTAAPRACRDRRCPEYSISRRGWCAAHDQPDYKGGKAELPPDWERIRARVLRRDGHRCVLCGAEASDVDHVVARSAGGDSSLGNLRSLCSPCHRTRTASQGGQAAAASR